MGIRSGLINAKASVDAHYGWWLVAAGIVIVLLPGDALRIGYTAALFWRPLEASGINPIWTITSVGLGSGVLVPFAGLAVDRFGPRRMIVAGLSLCGLVSIAAAALPVSIVPLALYPLLTLGILVGTKLPVMASINHWFYHRRTLAIAVTLFAVSALNLLLLRTTAIPGNTFTNMAFGLLVIGVGLPLALIFVRPLATPARTAEAHQPAGSGTINWNDGYPSVDYGWKEAVKTREFWLLALAGAFLAGADQLVMAQVYQLAGPRFQMERSYRMFSDVHEIFSVVCILIGAALSMRVGLRTALLALAALQLVGLAVILVANGPGWFFAGIAALGAGHGGTIALGISVLGEYFGRQRFATLLGTQGLLTVAFQGVVFGLPPAISSWMTYPDLPSNPSWTLAAALVPTAAGVAAYWKLGDPKPAPSRLATTTDG